MDALLSLVSLEDFPDCLSERDQTLSQRKRGGVLGAKAREALRLPSKGTLRVKRSVSPAGYAVFIQSTSVNRILPTGSELLYEVPFDA